MKELVEYIVKSIVTDPEKVSITTEDSEEGLLSSWKLLRGQGRLSESKAALPRRFELCCELKQPRRDESQAADRLAPPPPFHTAQTAVNKPLVVCVRHSSCTCTHLPWFARNHIMPD